MNGKSAVARTGSGIRRTAVPSRSDQAGQTLIRTAGGEVSMKPEMRFDPTLTLSINMNRKGNPLTPTLSSTSVWRRGRWNNAHGFWGSMRGILRRILSPRRGDKPTPRRANQTKSNLRGEGKWTVVSGQWQTGSGRGTSQTQSNPVKPSQTGRTCSMLRHPEHALAGARTN
jgi:hypothetical protein